MAKSQIGAVIGIEGARQFSSDMQRLTMYTKQFSSEMKALTASFDKNKKSVQDVNKQREVLNKLLTTANDKLFLQKQTLDRVNQAAKNTDVTDKDWIETQSRLQTEINKTTAEIEEYKRQLEELPSTARLVTDAWQNATSDWGELFKGVGDTLTKYVTAPLLAGAGVAVKTAIDYQSAFTGVKKTVDELVDSNGNITYSYEQLNDQLKQIPLRTASSYQSVAAVAEAAGQLGIAIDEIPKYAENIIMLGDSTNISAEEAATSIAQFMNIVGDSTDSIDKFGASLVALGNNTATDEASILRLATRLASAGHLVGLTTPEILGLSAAMSSVGLTAEAGGTAMSQAMSKITKAVANGGETLDLFGEITGQTGEQFAETWRNEPIKALEEFLVGLSNLEGGSEELILMLDELGFSGIRESDTLRRLTSDYDGVTKAVDLATSSYITNEEALNGQNALTEEASKRYETWASQISQLKEALLQLADEIGQELLPDLIELVNGAKGLVQKWRDLSPETKRVWINILKVAAAVGPLLSVFGSLLITVAKVKAAFSVLSGSGGIGGLLAKLVGGNSLTEGMQTATTATEGLTSGIGGLVSGLAGSLGIVGGYAAAMYVLLGSDWDATKEWADNMSDEIGGVCQDWDTYGQTVSTTLSETGEYIDVYGDANAKLLKDKTDEAKDNTIESIEVMKNGVYRRFSVMKTETGGVLDSIVDKMNTSMVQMKKSVSTEGEQVKQEYKMVLTGIDKEPLPDLYSSGAHMMESMKRGISSKESSIISTVAGIAAKIKAFLGFSEPEEGPLSNFHTFMPDMMKLMAQGINQNMFRVEDALNNVSSMMATNLEDRGNNVSYGGVTINLNVPQGTDGKALVDQIETEIANRTMRRRMVFN